MLSLPAHVALLLVSHGSRDPRPQQEVEDLAVLVQAECDRRSLSTRVGTAALECHPLPLHQQIQQFGQQAIAAGCQSLRVVPLFLLPGVHVQQDIPEQFALAIPKLQDSLPLQLCPYLGSHPGLKTLLQGVPTSAQTGRIVLGHGSRRAGGNQPVEAIAQSLQAIPAYWSMPPDMETQVTALVQAGHRQVVVMPYLLFSGGIVEAIAQRLQTLAQQHPAVHLELTSPLGATPALARLVVDLLLPPG